MATGEKTPSAIKQKFFDPLWKYQIQLEQICLLKGNTTDYNVFILVLVNVFNYLDVQLSG